MASKSIQCGFESHPGHSRPLPRRHRRRVVGTPAEHGSPPGCRSTFRTFAVAAARPPVPEAAPERRRRPSGSTTRRCSASATCPHRGRWSSRTAGSTGPACSPSTGLAASTSGPWACSPWQWEIVERHPAAFLRGLFHSDGARVKNWATRLVQRRARPGRRRVAAVRTANDLRLDPRRRRPSGRAHRPEVVSRVPRRAGGRPARPR